MILEDLRNKRIGILGFDRNNRGITAWLLRHNLGQITILDEGVISQDDSINVHEWRTGADAFSKLTDFDVLIRTPGVKLSRPELVAAKKAGVEITSQTRLFFEFAPAQIVGVTGTKGKGTTASLIRAVLDAVPAKQGNVYLAGNIGLDPFEFIDDLGSNDVVVLELSSFQLQDLDKSPHVAVVLGITSEHLDYHSTTEEYTKAKTSIVRFQTENDIAVINADSNTARSFSDIGSGQAMLFSRNNEVEKGAFVRWVGKGENRVGEVVLRDGKNNDVMVLRSNELKLRGEHNLDNVMAAVLGAYVMGAPMNIIHSAICEFPGYEHRLQFIGEINGVACYDDSAATAPDPTMAAVRSFRENVHLIVGGATKNLDFAELGQVIAKESTVVTITPLGDAEAPKIVAAVEGARIGNRPLILPTVFNMRAAVQSAHSQAAPGDVILLSPAATGFDLFKNYVDRGNQFLASVKELQNKSENQA